MSDEAARDLIDLLELEPLEHNIYRGRNRDIGTGRIYGGQVLAQALTAASRTVEEERPIHSFHGYFILPGDLSAPVVYFVDRLPVQIDPLDILWIVSGSIAIAFLATIYPALQAARLQPVEAIRSE